MTLKFAAPTSSSIPLHLVAKDDWASWLETRNTREQNWLASSDFNANLGAIAVMPDDNGAIAFAVAGYGSPEDRTRTRFGLAAAAAKLPNGSYQLNATLSKETLAVEALGWLLGQYRFGRYKISSTAAARLVAPKGIDVETVEAMAAAECLTRDLINTPANDMGPDELEEAARELAQTHGAEINVITGADLLAQNFPLIHTVGRAANREPRLLDMTWGAGPTVTLVGKGVCFDTGGLNLKPGSSMGLMKKDMGGAATVLGLAQLIMATNAKIRLRVLIPAVENAVAGNAFRPGDVLMSRAGLSVEINNTDAEGRLVLADALALASEENPDLLISMATLTGAARVAVGPDLAPFYTDDDNVASALSDASSMLADPVWRMPFWDPYEAMIEPAIADLDNAPGGGFAGSITAALFLRRFAAKQRYVHFDIYGWNPNSAPGRPKGGAGQGARALFGALSNLLRE